VNFFSVFYSIIQLSNCRDGIILPKLIWKNPNYSL